MNITIAIYDVTDGRIVRREVCPGTQIICCDGEEFYLNCPPDATHIVDGLPQRGAE